MIIMKKKRWKFLSEGDLNLKFKWTKVVKLKRTKVGETFYLYKMMNLPFNVEVGMVLIQG